MSTDLGERVRVASSRRGFRSVRFRSTQELADDLIKDSYLWDAHFLEMMHLDPKWMIALYVRAVALRRCQCVRASGEASAGRPVRADNSRRVPPVSFECVCLPTAGSDERARPRRTQFRARLGTLMARPLLSETFPTGRRRVRQTPATSRACA